MPTYEFECSKCGRYEIRQSIHEDLPTKCKCGIRVRQIYYAPAIRECWMNKIEFASNSQEEYGNDSGVSAFDNPRTGEVFHRAKEHQDKINKGKVQVGVGGLDEQKSV